MRIFVRLLALFVTLSASAQHLVDQKIFDAIARDYSGESAQENTRRIVEYHRIQGSPMMAAVAEQVVLPAAQGVRPCASLRRIFGRHRSAWVDRLVSILAKQHLVATQ